MRQDDDNRGCLSQDDLGVLAIRISQGISALEKSGEGSLGGLPAGLFQPEEEEMRQHLEACPACRKQLLEELYSIRRYLEGLDNPANDGRFDELIERIRSQGTAARQEYIETVLYYDSFNLGEYSMALAAASVSEKRQPVRFSSEDGTMILKELSIKGADRPKFQLIADDPELASGAEVIIGDVTLYTDQNGLLEYDGTELSLSDNMSIIIRSQRN